MRRIVLYIELLEKHLLRWLRLATVAVVALVIVVAVLTFLISLMNISASTEVEIGSMDDVTFSEPSIRNIEPPPPDQAQGESDERATESTGDGPYASEVAEMVGALIPLMDAVDSNVSASAIKHYVEDRLDDLADTISGTMGLRGSESTRRLSSAVDGMVDYVDDLVDFYGDEIDLEISDGVGTAGKKIHPPFEARLKNVLQAPLHGYVSAYQDEAEAVLAIAQREADEGRESIESGMAGMASLPTLGMLELVLLFLLLLFKIEIRLSGNATGVRNELEDGHEIQE